MAVLGTKKFWKPNPAAKQNERDNQILKNAGYINVQLYTVNYMSKGNFWQRTFGGNDSIALATTIKYQTGFNSIEASAVQDVRKVKANRNYNLGLQRNLAVKIPALADSISIDIKMTAIKSDSVQAKFDMLCKPEYQSALQLAPALVGHVLTVTSLVKGLFSDSDPNTQLEASYAGTISVEVDNYPVRNGKLTQGTLIMISTDEQNNFADADESEFRLNGDTLFYGSSQVENTYLVLNITFESLKGNDETSNWFKKYTEALHDLDKLISVVDQTEIERIFNDSKMIWVQGNALLDADETYIYSEKVTIKAAAFMMIREKYLRLNPSPQSPSLKASDAILDLSGSGNFNELKNALPATGSYLNSELSESGLKQAMPLSSMLANLSGHDEQLMQLLAKDANDYLSKLNENGIGFNLNLPKSDRF